MGKTKKGVEEGGEEAEKRREVGRNVLHNVLTREVWEGAKMGVIYAAWLKRRELSGSAEPSVDSEESGDDGSYVSEELETLDCQEGDAEDHNHSVCNSAVEGDTASELAAAAVVDAQPSGDGYCE